MIYIGFGLLFDDWMVAFCHCTSSAIFSERKQFEKILHFHNKVRMVITFFSKKEQGFESLGRR